MANDGNDNLVLAKPDGSLSPPSIDENHGNSSGASDPAETLDFKRGFRFWVIILGISVTSLQGSLENSVVVTAGPAIVNDLGMGEEYIWITNAFFICWCVFSVYL